MKAMRTMQRLQKYTGATHAAAWMNIDGTIELVREDVGRHNALDKLIGAMAAKRMDFSAGAALITSRASYEMVQKSATMGIGFLAAISAPTSLAIQLAEEANVTLIGFVRNQSHVIYAQSHRLIRDAIQTDKKGRVMSHITCETLVTMANQIGDFFGTMKDHAISRWTISAGHLKRSWDPRMRIA
jgi:regulator of extracellular matrix RemA (YlzA/DUF370 family)